MCSDSDRDRENSRSAVQQPPLVFRPVRNRVAGTMDQNLRGAFLHGVSPRSQPRSAADKVHCRPRTAREKAPHGLLIPAGRISRTFARTGFWWV